MADTILPDDVFENMMHAQEAAENMEKTVADFNTNIEKNFSDKNEQSKIKEEIKPTLTTQEKTRYKNIGNAFFEGAKNQIIEIFKQIEKNKKKEILRKAAPIVANTVEPVKENASEHKTGLKILGVIALIGGIYFMFKSWFDDNMPKIWEGLKESIASLANGAADLSSKLANMLANNDILNAIKDFVIESGKVIANFFNTIGSQITSLFKDTGAGSASSFTESVSTNEQEEIDRIQERIKSDPVFAALYKQVGNIDKWNDKISRYSKELDELYKLQQKGISKTANGEDVLERIKDLQEGIEEKKAEREKDLKLITDAAATYKAQEDKFAETLELNDKQHVFAQIKKARDEGDFNRANELLKNTGILQKMAEEHSFYWAAGSENDLEELMFAARDGDKEARAYLSSIIDSISNRVEQKNGTNKKTTEEIQNAEAEAEKTKQEIEKNKEKMIRSTNVPKLTNVAVISSLDEFVRNFFDGDKPGSFKAFSSEFLTGFKEVIENFRIGASISKHVNSLHNKVNKISDNLGDYETSIINSLNDKTETLKNTIKNTFENSYVNEINECLDDIAKYEKEQIECLNEQLEVLKQTTMALITNGNNKNVTIIQNPQQEGKSVLTSEQPNLPDTSTAVYFSSGMSPYSMA